MKAKYLYIVSVITLGLIGCSQKHENVEVPLSSTMLFNIVPPNATRVADGAFEAEDKLGIYVADYVDSATPAPLQISGNRANNEALIFDGASWAPERTIYWGEGKSDVYAYYPYMEVVDVDEQPFYVALDQDTDGAYEASDLLWAKAEGVARADGAVPLAMNHAMSRLVVKIMAGEEYVGSLPKDATVLLHSTVTDARISLANGSVVKDPYGGTHSIKMRNLGLRAFADGEAVVYEAIVVPQMLEGIVPLLEINSKSVSYLLEDAFNFKPGVSYTYTVVLNTSTTAIKVEIGCEIEDWNNIGGGSEGEGGSGSEGGEDDDIDLSLYTDLSAEGTANCYLIKTAGNYKFKATMGNTESSVGNVKKTEVLWETFGTDVMPNVGDLIATTGYKNGYVYFSTPETFRNGNVSIAVRNSKDVILWSWHIWCSEEGWNDHVYPNNAGIMMDRNLGATSATPGDVGAFGLLYQWGRKDPFMGAGDISKSINGEDKEPSASTGIWSKASETTIDFCDKNPMIMTTRWYKNNVPRYGWQTSELEKGIYDPCPIGYRVPDGGENGFWATANVNAVKDSTNKGSLCTLADGESVAWYPYTGVLSYGSSNFIIERVGNTMQLWSATPHPEYSESSWSSYLSSVNKENACYAFLVRCVKE